jgi:hypothetical protein
MSSGRIVIFQFSLPSASPLFVVVVEVYGSIAIIHKHKLVLL